MSRKRLKDLAERMDALEALGPGSADAAGLEARLSAIEDALRRLRNGHEGVGEIGEEVRRWWELVDAHAPVGARVALVAAAESTAFIPPNRSVPLFPELADPRSPERGFDHSAGAIAHLEALRVGGLRYLLVPEPARAWVRRYPEFGEHLLRRYQVVADEPGVGLIVDVGAVDGGRRPEPRLGEVLDRLADGDRWAPVLDWTGLGLASLVPDRNVFTSAPDSDRALTYLDRTIEVVVVEDPAKVDEARRVASGAVVVISADEDGRVEVTAVEEVGARSASADDQMLLLVEADDPEDPWLARVREAVAEQPAISIVASPDPWATAADAEGEVVVLAERGVLPLPGCLEAASAAAAGPDVGAAAVKLIAADGRLEAAGSTVFADGSVAGVAAGCGGLAAPWHEYVRPVCAATGLLAVRSEVSRELAGRSGSLVALSAALWEAGYELRYQPDAWAVRALDRDDRGVAEDEADAAAWAPALAARPERPPRLDEPAWRRLLAREDAEACWR